MTGQAELMPVAEGRTRRAPYTFKADPHSSHSIILRWLREGRGRCLLDVGAADGLLSRPLTDRGWRVTAIERDPDLAAVGALCCERMLVADLDREIPKLDGSFDVIVYADILEHLSDPLKVLVTMNRALAPDGQIIISTPNVANLWIRMTLLAGRFEYTERGILDRTHLRFFTSRSLNALLSAAGLRIVRRTATPVPLDQVVPVWAHGPWLTGFQAVSAALTRWLPRLLGYQFVVLARPEAHP